MTPTSSSKLCNWFEDQDCDAMQAFQLFENIPGLSFFLKDTNHRLLHMNKRFLPRIGLASNDELYGKTDFDIFLPDLRSIFEGMTNRLWRVSNQCLISWNWCSIAKDYLTGI